MQKKLVFIISILFVIFFISNNAISQDQQKVIEWLKGASEKEKVQYWFLLSSELKKLVPINVDSETLLFNTAPQKNGLAYNYKLINSVYGDLSQNQWEAKISTLAKESLNRFCTTPDSLLFRESNADIRINYYDNEGVFLGEISFNAGSDCMNID